jgi:hypothetical protein
MLKHAGPHDSVSAFRGTNEPDNNLMNMALVNRLNDGNKVHQKVGDVTMLSEVDICEEFGKALPRKMSLN